MNPLVILIVEMVVKYAPVLAIELVQILSKKEATDADWDTLKAKYYGKTYESYVPPVTPPV